MAYHLGRENDSEKLGRQFYKNLNEVRFQEIPNGLKLPNSYTQLVESLKIDNYDMKTFAVLLRAMMEKLERAVSESRLAAVRNKNLEENCITDCIDCLSLNLKAEYSSRAHGHKQSPLPAPSLFAHTDNAYHHVMLFTDNVLAASVVVRSAVQASLKPEKLVFHIITDKKTYARMCSWFELNSVAPAIVEVKGVHQFDWLTSEDDWVLDPTTLSNFQSTSLNHLRVHIPQLFPYLEKVVFLDDDLVVHQDIAPLWDLNLGGKINGAVETCRGGDEWIMPKPLKNYFNFSHPVIVKHLDPEERTWEYGMNVFDLQAWRQTNITETYHFWIRENVKSNLTMWKLKTLSPFLLAFKGHVHIIDSSWRMFGTCHSSV